MTVLGRRDTLAIGLLAAAQLWGCGMKGPPLAPFVRVPAAVGELVVQRLGDEASIGFTLPTANEDRSEPASLVRVDVYAMTTQPRLPPDRELDLEEFIEAATLVASIEVAPPPEPEAEDAPTDESPPDEAPPGDPPPAEAPGEDAALSQGSPVLLTELLTTEIESPVDPWEEERRLREEAEAEAGDEEDAEEPEEPERPVMAPLMTPPLPGPLQREYVVVQVSEAGDESAGGARIAVPLGIRVPEPPPAPEVVYTEATVDVTWGLPPGVRETVQGPATAEPDEEAEGTGAEGAGQEDTESAEGAGREDTGSGEGAGQEAAGPAEDAAAAPPAAASASGETPASDDARVSDAAADEAADPAETPADDAGADAVLDAEAVAAGDEADPASDEAEVPVDEAEAEDESAAPAGPPPPLESRPIVEWPPASTYEVFEIVAEAEDGSAAPARLSQAPLEAPSYSEPRGEYGVERCYAVRTLDVVAGFEARSRLSPVTCVTFVDTFPPAAPEALTAVGSQGEVSLLWRPNDEDDLAGYLVLRGLPGDETLQPLTDAPLVENTYRDVTAEPGVRHVYAVRAVDTAPAPNLSEPSDPVEAAAR